jgi:dTDP-glucose pyrophosphorylase
MIPSLVILAAGLGSRYGSLKQIDKLGPNGETILDYSINYAIRAGVKKIVFVIRKNIEDQLKEVFFDKYSKLVELDYVFQELDSLPSGVQPNPERTKPWGTGHAVLMVKDKLKEPFIVIGCDDFYGYEAFAKSFEFLKTLSATDSKGCLIGYYLKNTLSEHGFVSRGICQVDELHNLVQLGDKLKIKEVDGQIISFEDEANPLVFARDTIASMSFYGFTPQFLNDLEQEFLSFIKQYSGDLKKEFYITNAMSDLIEKGKLEIAVYNSLSKWFGITNQADKPVVMQNLRELKETF